MSDVERLGHGTEKSDSIVTRVKEFLGISYDVKVCDTCNQNCVETTVHDPRTAAFYEGETPAWECENCGRTYYREDKHESHTMDLYSRD